MASFRPVDGQLFQVGYLFVLCLAFSMKAYLDENNAVFVNRRRFASGLAALGLLGCTRPGSFGNLKSTSPADLSGDLQPVPNAGYDVWVRDFRSRAVNQGFSDELLTKAFSGAGYLPGVVTRDRNQTEFTRTLEDYLSIAVSDERVTRGRAAFSRHRATLTAIESAFGVDAYIIAAIWGLESFYGERRGNVPVVSSTSTLAYDGRRGRFFERQLIVALQILRDGQTTAPSLVGSWAGAMGHTQFIPTEVVLNFRPVCRRAKL